MGGEESKQEHSNPEQSGGSGPVEVNGKHEKHKSHGREKIAEYYRCFWTWFKKFGEPLTVVTLLLFAATVALYLATRALVHDAEKTAERQLRAYVGMKREGGVLGVNCPDCDLVVSVPNQPQYRNSILMILKNFGQTPAYQPYVCPGLVEVPVGSNVSNATANKIFKECDETKLKVFVSTIWPTEERRFLTSLTEANVASIRNGGRRDADIFFIARIEYTDVFDEGRASYVCYQFHFESGAFGFTGCDVGPKKDK